MNATWQLLTTHQDGLTGPVLRVDGHDKHRTHGNNKILTITGDRPCFSIHNFANDVLGEMRYPRWSIAVLCHTCGQDGLITSQEVCGIAFNRKILVLHIKFFTESSSPKNYTFELKWSDS